MRGNYSCYYFPEKTREGRSGHFHTPTVPREGSRVRSAGLIPWGHLLPLQDPPTQVSNICTQRQTDTQEKACLQQCGRAGALWVSVSCPFSHGAASLSLWTSGRSRQERRPGPQGAQAEPLPGAWSWMPRALCAVAVEGLEREKWGPVTERVPPVRWRGRAGGGEGSTDSTF